MRSDKNRAETALSVVVVAICGMEYLRRCLHALNDQDVDSEFEIIVVYDEALKGIPLVKNDFPTIKLCTVSGMSTPEELASAGIRQTTGRILALTEDHCMPDRFWCRRLLEAHTAPHAAVGGAIECATGSVLNWAFAFTDYYRYLNPVPEGRTPYLTVCNVSYKRPALEKIAAVWQNYFHETHVNAALRRRGEKLWLTAGPVVYQEREMKFWPAVHERYSFGRYFGSRRVTAIVPVRRWFYALASPAIPFVLLGRMAKNILRRRRLWGVFVKAVPLLAVFTLAWTWGEFLGYLFGRAPKAIYVARD